MSFLHSQLLSDQQFLASSPVAKAVIDRYLLLTQPDYYNQDIAHSGVFRKELESLHATHERPGTPATRFRMLFMELRNRWVDPEPFSAMAPEGRFLKWLDALIAENKEWRLEFNHIRDLPVGTAVIKAKGGIWQQITFSNYDKLTVIEERKDGANASVGVDRQTQPNGS
jgi:hypothetical protein